jgi:hypothetical protein
MDLLLSAHKIQTGTGTHPRSRHLGRLPPQQQAGVGATGFRRAIAFQKEQRTDQAEARARGGFFSEPRGRCRKVDHGV